MAFEDWESFAAGPLHLPIKGKTYVVPRMSAKAGLELAATADQPPAETDDEILESYRPLLTDDIFEQMLEDGVERQAMIRAGLTVHIDYRMSRDLAEQFWRHGTIPEALAALAAAKATTETRPKTPTAAARTPTARGTGSTTRPNTKTSSTKAASRSRGAGSSRSGR